MPKSSLKKFISTVLFFIFTVTNLGQDAHAWASFPSEVSNIQPSFELNIPPDLGTIHEVNSGSGPVIIQIQTAHGSYEAQKNIQAILHYLKDKYGVKFLLLEGSGSQLQPELLNLFPGKNDLNMKAAEALTHEALVKGDELFLLEEKDAEAYGIEDIPAYRRAREIFKRVILEKETAREFLKDLDLQIERLTASYLSPELRTFLKNKESFEGEKTSFQAWLLELRNISRKRLQLDLSQPSAQFDWPMLTRTLKLQEYESKINPNILEKEKKTFKENIAKFLPQRHSEIERILNLPLSHNGIADETAIRVIENMISALPQSFPYAYYPNLEMFFGRLIIQSEINPSLLMSELERLTAEIIQKMSRSEEETKWTVLLTKYEILRRLFALELTPADYEVLLSGKESFRPSVLTQAFKAVNHDKRVKDFDFKHLNEIDKLFEVSMDFYKGTKERDGIMLRNIQKKMDEKHTGKAVVITGGFHAKVFKDFFTSKGFNYALISPKITSSQGHEEYLRAVLQTDPEKIVTSTMDLPRRMETPAVQQAMGENIVFVNAAVDRVIKNIIHSEATQASGAAPGLADTRLNSRKRSEVRSKTELTPDEEMRRVLEIYPRIAEHTAEYGLHHLLTAGKYFWQEDSDTEGVFDLHIKGNPEDDDKWGECTVGSCLAARTLNENGIEADVFRIYMSGETMFRPLDTGKLDAFKSWDYLRKAVGKLSAEKSVEIVPIMQSHAIARTRSGFTAVDASGFYKTYSDQSIPVWNSANYPVSKSLLKGFARKVYEESGYRNESIIFPLTETEKKDADFPRIGYQPVKLHKLKGVEGHELTIMTQLGIGRLKETQDFIFSYAATYRIFDPETQTYKAPQSLYFFWTIPQKEFFDKIQPTLKRIASSGDSASAQEVLFGSVNKPKIIINEGADGSPKALSPEWGRMPEIFEAAEGDFSYFVSFMAAIPKFPEPPAVVFLFKPRVPEDQIESVYVSGSFNGWANPGIPMEKKNGLWTVQRPLKRKPYEYKYQIKFKDGRIEWVSYQDDIYNPDVNRGTSDNYGVNRGLEIKDYLYWKFKPGTARELAKNFTKLLFSYLDHGLVVSSLAEGSLENFRTEQWIWSYVQFALNDRSLLREKPESFGGYSREIIQQALVEMIHRDGPGPVYDLSEIEEGIRDAWPSGSQPRSELRGKQTVIRYPATTRGKIEDWFEKKIGFGGVSVQGGSIDPKNFDRKEFNLINNPWKLDYGVPIDWARNKLLPLMEAIANPHSAADKEPALKEMVSHHLKKGPLPETWEDMPVVPEILFPLSKTPGILNSLKGQRSNITFNLIPGETGDVFYPVIIKTGENIEEEAIYDAVFDRAGLKEFIGVLNLPAGEKGIVYRIIPSGNSRPRGDQLTVHVVSELLTLHGFPSQLQTRFGTAILDLANFKDDPRNGPIVREVIKKYNEIYTEQIEKKIRSEVRSEKAQKDKRDEAIDFLSRSMPDLEEEYDLPAGRDLFFRFNGSKHEREGVYHGSDFRDIAGALDLVGLGSGDKYWTWGVGTGRDLLVANAFGADIAAGEELGEPAFKAAEKIIYGKGGAQDIVSLAKAAGHDIFDTEKISIHQADWFKDGILSPSGQRRLKDFDVFYYYIHGSIRQDEMAKILAQNMHERAVLIVYDPFGGWNVPKDLKELKVSRWTRNGRIHLYVKPGSPLLAIRKESKKAVEKFDRRAADVKTLYLEGWKTTQATLEFLDHFPNASNITVHNPEMTDVDIFRMVQGFFRGAGNGQGSVKFTGGRAFDIEWKGRMIHFELTAEAFQGNADAMVLDSPRNFMSDRRTDEKLKPYFESLYQHLNPGGLMMLADSPAYYFPFEFAWLRTAKIDYLGNKSFPEDQFSDWRIFQKSISFRSELRSYDEVIRLTKEFVDLSYQDKRLRTEMGEESRKSPGAFLTKVEKDILNEVIKNAPDDQKAKWDKGVNDFIRVGRPINETSKSLRKQMLDILLGVDLSDLQIDLVRHGVAEDLRDRIEKVKVLVEKRRKLLTSVKEQNRRLVDGLSGLKEAVESYRSAPRSEMRRKMEVEVQPDMSYEVSMVRDVFKPGNTAILDALKKIGASRVLFVADEGVGPETLEKIRIFSKQLGLPAAILSMPGGERAKDGKAGLENVDKITTAAEAFLVSRKDAFVIIGGGAVLDTAGFAASIFHRGVPYIRIPTTLLGQIDAGIGVKTGINYYDQKNFYGTFYPAKAVLIDPYLLKKLDERQMRSGMAEAVKVSLMKDADYFALLEKGYQDLLDKKFTGKSFAEEIMWRSVTNHLGQIKTDPFERELARPLDYGHEWGHRLEAVTHYGITHGEGVAIGTAIDTVISYRRGYISENDLERVLKLIENIGLPIFHEDATVENLWPGLESFRRHLGGKLTISLLGQIGIKKDVHRMYKKELTEALIFLKKRVASRSELRSQAISAKKVQEASSLMARFRVSLPLDTQTEMKILFSAQDNVENITFLNFVRTYWNELVEIFGADPSTWAGQLTSLRKGSKGYRLLQIFAPAWHSMSRFGRYSPEATTFEEDYLGDFESEFEARTSDENKGRKIQVLIGGPGFYQEPIEILWTIEKLKDSNAEIIILDLGGKNTLAEKFRSNEIYYDALDIKEARAIGLPVDEYFDKSPRGYRLKADKHARFRFVTENLNDPEALTRLAKQDIHPDFIFFRQVFQYLDEGVKGPLMKFFHQRLSADGVLYSGFPITHFPFSMTRKKNIPSLHFEKEWVRGVIADPEGGGDPILAIEKFHKKGFQIPGETSWKINPFRDQELELADAKRLAELAGFLREYSGTLPEALRGLEIEDEILGWNADQFSEVKQALSEAWKTVVSKPAFFIWLETQSREKQTLFYKNAFKFDLIDPDQVPEWFFQAWVAEEDNARSELRSHDDVIRLGTELLDLSDEDRKLGSEMDEEFRKSPGAFLVKADKKILNEVIENAPDDQKARWDKAVDDFIQMGTLINETAISILKQMRDIHLGIDLADLQIDLVREGLAEDLRERIEKMKVLVEKRRKLLAAVKEQNKRLVDGLSGLKEVMESYRSEPRSEVRVEKTESGLPIIGSYRAALKAVKNAPVRTFTEFFSQDFKEGFYYRGVYGREVFENYIKSGKVKNYGRLETRWTWDMSEAQLHTFTDSPGENVFPKTLGVLLEITEATMLKYRRFQQISWHDLRSFPLDEVNRAWLIYGDTKEDLDRERFHIAEVKLQPVRSEMREQVDRDLIKQILKMQDKFFGSLDKNTADGIFIPAEPEPLIEFLQKVLTGDETLIDLGSGSGIVLIAALLAGVRGALGIESNPELVHKSREFLREVGKKLGIANSSLAPLAQGTNAEDSIIEGNFLNIDLENLGGKIPKDAKRVYFYFVGGTKAFNKDQAKSDFLDKISKLPPGSKLILYRMPRFFQFDDYEVNQILGPAVLTIQHSYSTATRVYEVRALRSEMRSVDRDRKIKQLVNEISKPFADEEDSGSSYINIRKLFTDLNQLLATQGEQKIPELQQASDAVSIYSAFDKPLSKRVDIEEAEIQVIRFFERFESVSRSGLRLHDAIYQAALYAVISPSRGVAEAAVEAVMSLPREQRQDASDYLKELAQNPDISPRILHALIRVFRERENIQTLANILRQQDSGTLKSAALEALGDIAGHGVDREAAFQELLNAIFDFSLPAGTIRTAVNAFVDTAPMENVVAILAALLNSENAQIRKIADEAFFTFARRFDPEFKQVDSAPADPSSRSELRLIPETAALTPALKTRVEFTGYLFPLAWVKKFGKESLMKALTVLGLLTDQNNRIYSKSEIQAAKKFLGIQSATQIPDAFILGSDLALNNGGLVLIDTFLKGSAVAIAADSKEAVDRLELYNKERAAKGQKPVLIVKKLDEAEKAFAGRFKNGVNLYGFASPDEISEEWARILKDKLQVFNARRMEVFAETFGVSKLLESFKARFSFAKSA